ncbi:histone deacetylase [soil metagenome]
MRAFYSDHFVLPLPAGHRFPMDKYRRLRERCVAEGVLQAGDLREAPAIGWETLGSVHTWSYLAAVRDGTLDAREQRRLGFPWSPQFVERSRRSAGATLAAATAALDGAGVAVNLAGGTHHAHAGHGEGFCVFNDAAVTIRALQAEGRVRRAAVIDCDVHQGNGTAEIFASDPDVLTFSLHGADNYPFRKARSTIDVALPSGAGDAAVLAALELHLADVVVGFRPDLVVYLAGADPFREDRFGRLAMSKDGLAERDELVLQECRGNGVPVAVVMAGGYGRDTADTVDIHLETVRLAAGCARVLAPVAG